MPDPVPPAAIVLGGTGAIGKELVRELAHSGSFSSVRCLVRNMRGADYYGIDATKKDVLEEVKVEFDKLEDYADSYKGFEFGFSAFGTTRKDAGGAEAFKRIDMGYNITSAKLMKAGGVRHMQLVSSQGADATGFFLYTKTKGLIENELTGMVFEKLTIWRPGLLAGRPGGRTGESIANCLCPNSMRIHVKTVAKAMLYNTGLGHTAANGQGVKTIEMQDIKKYVVAEGGREALENGM